MNDDLAQKLKAADVIRRGTVKLRSGKTADFYFDIKKAYGDPELLNLMADELWAKINKQATCLAASGYGGLPLAAAISSRHGIPLTLVRDKVKTHGTESMIDGYVPSDKDVVAIVDDVFTTGSSLKDTISNLVVTKAAITGCYVIVKRGDGELPAPLTYLIKPSDLEN